MKANTSDVVFVFPPAYGNLGVFKNHLGVAYLRTALAKNGITTTQYLNEHPNAINEIAASILKYKPRIVGFTAYDANFLTAIAIARALKQQKPETQVVMGGPTATFGAEQILSYHPVVDVCVMGEAEETGSYIFSTLLDGHPLNDSQPGVAFREDGKIVCNDLPPLVGATCPDVQSALDSTPSPYLSGILTDGRAGVLSGRGCTHHCQYCVFAALGRKQLRLHSIERVLAELEYIADQQKQTGQNYMVAIHDDAFTLLPNRAKKLCKAIINKNIQLVLSCITRADAVDDELLQLMQEAGFISLAFGLESAVPSVLRATGKVRPCEWPNPDLGPERHFVEQVETNVTNAKKLGFNVGVSIILGLPTETEADGAATLRFVKKLPVDFYMHNFLWVFPGTPLWESHDRYGIKCTINEMGLPTTYEYAYDITKLRPRPKCSLEQDAKTINLLTTHNFQTCKAGSNGDKGINTAIVNAPELDSETADWLTDVLTVGGLVIQVYPHLKRSDEAALLYDDRCTLSDNLVPARHYVQLTPGNSAKENFERWRITCTGIDLYAKHKPSLISIFTHRDHAPIVDWLKGMSAASTLCEISDYLRRPDELVRFLDESGEHDANLLLQSMPIPPQIKYPERWLKGETPCLSLTRIEIDAQGQVRCCHHGEPIGTVGDSRESMIQRLRHLVNAANERRGCEKCPNTHCPRCPFPGIPEQTYCNIMTNQTRVLRLVQLMNIYARLPLTLVNQRDLMASE